MPTIAPGEAGPIWLSPRCMSFPLMEVNVRFEEVVIDGVTSLSGSR